MEKKRALPESVWIEELSVSIVLGHAIPEVLGELWYWFITQRLHCSKLVVANANGIRITFEKESK